MDLLQLFIAEGTPFTDDSGSWALPNEHVHWGPIVWAYLFLAGVGSGSLIVSILPRLPWAIENDQLMRLRRLAVITALACFIAIPIAVLASLHQPTRMWRVLFAPHGPSPMPYGSWALVILIGLTVFHLWHLHRPEFAYAAERRSDWLGWIYRKAALGYGPDAPATKMSHRGLQVVHVARIAAELVFVGYTAFLLSTMVSHPVWSTPTLGILFFLLAMSSGYAWLVFVGWHLGFLRMESSMLKLLAGSGAAFLLGVMGLRVWEMAWGRYLNEQWWDSFAEMQFSRLGVSFFLIEALGGIVAIGLLTYGAWKVNGRAAWMGGALGLVVLAAIRWHVVVGGQMMSRTQAGQVPFELEILGAEGLIATASLFLITGVMIAAMVWFLPWRTAKHATKLDETRPEEEVAAAKTTDRRRIVILLAGVAAGIAGGYATIRDLVRPHYRVRAAGPSAPSADRVVNSICLSCDARCGNRAIIRDGVVRNLLGNPFHPASTMNKPIPMETSVDDGLRASGSLCMKGVSGLQYLYDPYRIRLPLKRTGPRGSGQFAPIPWDQLIEELTDGGRLFAGIGEDREIEGLAAIRSSDPIDPDQPELGPKSYGLVWNTGRGQPGRQEFIERFLKAYGSTNYVSHTDLCQMNFYVANYVFTGRYNPDVTGHSQLFGDIVNSKYMLFFGVNLGGGWKPGVNTSAPILANRHAAGDGKLVLIDPYVPHGRHYADEWVPIAPRGDAALALGMMRSIIDNERYAADYLALTSEAAAEAAGESTWLNGTYLVVQSDDDPRHRLFLRARDVGLGDDEYVVMNASGVMTTHLDTDAGELFVTTTVTDVDGVELEVKSSLQLLRDEVFSKSMDEWSELCSVPVADIERLADEFTSHGKQATASCYRGAVMHSQGLYAGWAINLLNAMVGNLNWRGGMVKNASGPAWNNGLYDLNAVPGAPETEGVHISRIGSKSTITYEESSEYARKVEAGEDPYPPKRPWYPITHAGITTEALAGADTGYPYKVACYVNYFINSRHSVPGGIRFEETFTNTDKIPLFISIDTTISETSIYSDYIVPDAMYLDGQWGFMGQPVGAVTAEHVAVRSPVVEPLTGRTDDGRPMLLETLLIDLAGRLDLPGYGPEGIVGAGDHEGSTFPLRTAEDYYLRAVANIASNAGVPAASAEELAYVESDYPCAASCDILPASEWRAAAYILARGGYFASPESAWDERGHATGRIRVIPSAPLQVWHEQLATSIEPGTGRTRPGTPTWLPAEDGSGAELDAADADEFPFHVVTFRLATRTKARTAYDYWAIETHPDNFLEVNPADAADLGIGDGDRVRVSSRSNGVEATVKVSARVSRGVVAGTHHFGHTQQGNSELQITDAGTVMSGTREFSPVMQGLDHSITSGDRVLADKRRGSRGFNINDAMRRNGAELADTPLVDNAGGATIFLDSRVKIERV